jgi:D-alanine-D-alanine ligase
MTFLPNKDKYKVWIFAPYLDTPDPNLQFYYDFTQSIAEYTKVFSEIQCEWEWVNITLQNLPVEIARIKSVTDKTNIIFNLCDGDEINGAPGISVIHALKEHRLIYTGSDASYYDITTSKITMKEAFEQSGVATPRWKALNGSIRQDLFDLVGRPAIIKPAVSAGSMGISIRNVVSDHEGLTDVLNTIHKGYHGWNLENAGLLAEEFIAGREFTTLVVGSSDSPEHIKCYEPVERVFHPSLPEKEQFLSFDRLWETYDEESPLPGDGQFYTYSAVASPELMDQLKALTIDAYRAVNGMGYGRADIRMDKSGNLFVLEINSQCGLSEDENYTSIGAILRVSSKTFANLVVAVLDEALLRQETIQK